MPKASALTRFHLVQRGEMSTLQTWLFRLLAVVGALGVGGVFLLLLGFNPFHIYWTMLKGSLGGSGMQKETIKLMIPLCLATLGVALAFKMRFWNIGAEGQICAGAIAASYFAYFHNDLPSPLLLAVMAIAAIIAGGLWGLIPAYFKTRYGTNETLFTLMLNYIVIYFITYLREGPWRNPEGGFASMPRFSKQARLPEALIPGIGNVHIGWIVMIVMVVLMFIYLRYTKQGYELSVVGENIMTARYAGMPVKRIVMRTMFISAGICGLVGMLQVAGPDRQLTDAVANGRGFTAVSIAWLARLSPFGIMIVSFLFSVMQKGCSMMQTEFRIPGSMSDILQGIILFFVLGSEFFIRYRIAIRKEVRA
ncbi:MAG: ABC transporter permease [Clostridiales bacterium]|nr:ABC transporter permease [Clostridiales bacterium]